MFKNHLELNNIYLKCMSYNTTYLTKIRILYYKSNCIPLGSYGIAYKAHEKMTQFQSEICTYLLHLNISMKLSL